MNMIKEKWDEILLTVKKEHDVTDVSYRTWLQPLEVYEVDEVYHRVTILVPSVQIGVDYIKRRYMFPIMVAIAEMTGSDYEIDFITPAQANQEEDENSELSQKKNLDAIFEKANLNPKYTFDTFVVGNTNKLAHAASLAVAETPSKIYNPLFLYGEAGLGKTHLMHSIAHYILTQDPSKNVLYVTSETFTNELIDAIMNGNNKNNLISSFREKYRNVDVLLIDDIQFIIGKERTQEEFFHTFNELHGNNKQIIISSDKPPKEMETLENRFRSRFEWGMLADIGAPDYETRIAILRKKEKAGGYSIDQKVIEYIANNIKYNIRELEGALNKLIALSNLEKREITVELAEEALKDIISPDQNREITADLIINTVAEHFGIQPSDIIGNKRSTTIVIPRQIVMYLCRYMIDMPLQTIGSYVGNRDHSTVIHGIKKIEGDIQSNDSIRNTVDIIQKKISPI